MPIVIYCPVKLYAPDIYQINTVIYDTFDLFIFFQVR